MPKKVKENIIDLEKQSQKGVFRRDLKISIDVARLTHSGNLFHKLGLTTLNAVTITLAPRHWHPTG